MSGRILKVGPPPVHVCELPPLFTMPPPVARSNGVELYDPSTIAWTPIGTVWQCECGDVWVVRWVDGFVGAHIAEASHSEWQQETRRERRRRLRSERNE